MAADAALEEELEALEALYPKGLRVQRASGGGGGGDDDGDAVVVVVALDVTPRTLDDATRQYVRATLVLTLDASYPESSPSINLTDARGLDDRRQGVVLDALQTARVECASAGDPVLALLCETAFETMTTLNHPDGDCVFCLDAVARAAGEEEDEEGGGGGDGGGGGGGGDENVVKMTRCYHCFHAACFARWWRWRLETRDEDARASGPAHPVGSEEALEAERRNVISCPVCRVAIDEEDAARALDRVDRGSGGGGGGGGSADASTSAPAFTEEETERLRAQRANFEAALERQRRRGGLIGEGDGEGIAIDPGTVPPPPPPPPPPRIPAPRGGGGGGGGGGGDGGGGLGWLKKAVGDVEQGVRDVNVHAKGGRGRGRGRGRGGGRGKHS
jgi:E3 ubiquitin-protein ligase RNF25